MTQNLIITRFAPSPTGYLHFGNARTALMAYLFAKKNKGKFILRIDNTDLERSKEEYTVAIKEDLAWLGLSYDSTFKQSEKIETYKYYTDKLIAMGRLYPCYETPEELEYKKKLQLAKGVPPIYDRAMLALTAAQKHAFEQDGRKPYYRFKMEHEDIAWHDICKGEVRYHGSNISDPVLIKDNGLYLFSLCSVIDDIDNHITHIIRGEDHMTNTAVHVQLFKCLGANPPEFGHIPLISILGGGEFSKRTGSLSLRGFKEKGIHPLAILNYLFMLGQPETNILYTSLPEIQNSFNLENYGNSTVKFDINKLDQINALVLQKLSFKEVKPYLNSLNLSIVTEELWGLYKHNITYLLEIGDHYNVLYGEIPVAKHTLNQDLLKIALDALKGHENFGINDIESWLNKIKSHTTDKGLKSKDVFIGLRMAVSAQEHGPNFKDLIKAIGFKKVKARLEANIK